MRQIGTVGLYCMGRSVFFDFESVKKSAEVFQETLITAHVVESAPLVAR